MFLPIRICTFHQLTTSNINNSSYYFSDAPRKSSDQSYRQLGMEICILKVNISVVTLYFKLKNLISKMYFVIEGTTASHFILRDSSPIPVYNKNENLYSSKRIFPYFSISGLHYDLFED